MNNQSTNNSHWINVCYWLFFSLAISIVPLIINSFKILLTTEDITFLQALEKTIYNGELILISTTLLSANIAELMRKTNTVEWKKIPAIGLSFVLALLSVASYVLITSTDPLESNSLNIFTYTLSLAIFVSTTVLCIASIILPENITN